MDIAKIQKHSAFIKTQAVRLLNDTDLEQVLSLYGEVFIHGSYPLDIMYSPDIDIVVQTDDPRVSSLKALENLLNLRQFRKFEYGDFVKYPLEKRPRGYIIVLKTTIEDVKWEIEIWFLNSDKEQRDNFNWIKERLAKDKKLEIIKAKHEREVSGISKYELSSFELYKKIL